MDDKAVAWYALPRAAFYGGNDVRLLRGGDELFPAMCAAIERAHHEVWLATYIFHHDEAALCVARALAAAAARGVRVRVVADGFGSKAALARLRDLWGDHGVAFAVFRPIHRWWNWLHPAQFRRLHHKLCVVDGEVAYVGGINLIDDRNDLHHGIGDAPRLDFAVELRGPVCEPVAQTVRAMWTRAAFGHDWRMEVMSLARSGEPIARARELVQRMRLPLARARARRAAAAEQQLRPVRVAFVVRDNLRQRRAIERSYVEAFAQARQRVDLVSPYFYPGRLFRRTLREAARRGVQVRLLLQGKLDYRIAGIAAQVLYDEMLRYGVRIYEYTPAFLHAKIAVADDDWATVGSSNIDPLSLLLNLEANVIVRDRAFAARVRNEFEQAIAVSREVTTPSVAHGWWPTLQRGVVAWCAHVYLRMAGITGRY